MSIAAENQPLPHRRRLKNMVPRRYRTAFVRKTEATAPLPHRDHIEM